MHLESTIADYKGSVKSPVAGNEWNSRVDAFLREVAELTDASAASAFAVSESTVRRWRELRSGGEDVPEPRGRPREALLSFVRETGRHSYGGREETPEEAIAVDWPNVSYLKDKAREEYERLLGQYLTRGWTSEIIAAAAHELTSFFRGENILHQADRSRPELTEEDQLLVLRAEAERIEKRYGRRGPAPRR